MGSEGPAERISIQEPFDTSSLARILREGQVVNTIEKWLQQHGDDIMNPRSDGTSLLNSFALLGSFDAVSYLLGKGAGTSILQADGSTILHSVVRTTEPSQDLTRSRLISMILESGNEVPVNHKNNKGWTPLKLAAKKGLEQCVEVLLNHGADPNIPDNEDYLPLHNAVGNKEVLKLLMESTTDINKQTQKGETPLYLSVDHGSVACSTMLLEHGGDPNIANNDGITPLFLASRGGNITLVRELLRNKAQPNTAGASQGIAPLHWAAHKESTDIALLLIEFGADVQQKDKEGRSPLSLASRELATKMIEQVARLRNQPITVTRAPSQMTALSKAMAACCGGNVPALRALLQTGGMNVNQICDTKNNSTFLLMAAYCGQVTVVAMLINSNADWNAKDKDGDTVLHFSCMNQNPGGNHLATLRFLLTTPAKSLIDTQNTRGDTPLHVAIRCKYGERAKVLIQHNANVMVTNSKKEYPLHRACCNDLNMEVILYLSDLIPDINTRDGDGWTALMYAARSNCPAILKYLLQRKADPNIQQSSQYSALHFAAQENYPEICRLLLRYHANPNILGGEQKVSPLHIAVHKGFKEVCRVLVENGADYNLRDNDNDTPLSLTNDEEIKSILQNTEQVARARSNSNPSPSNSPVNRTSSLKKSGSLEESDLSELLELRAKVAENEIMFEKIIENFKKLKDDNLQYQSRVWELEQDLRRSDAASRLALLPEEERAFRQQWWMIDTSELELTDRMLNNVSDVSVRFWDVRLGAFRSLDVAVKEVYRGEKGSDVRKCFFKEVEQLSHLQCPNIVQFFGAFSEGDRIGIITEYLPNGNLNDLLHTHKVELGKLQKVKIVRDIGLAMCYLHSIPVLHRALKPKNILLSEHFNAKIADFGFHETKKLNGYVKYLRSRCKDLKREDFPAYTAPEVFERNDFSKASDVYSFGMIVYELSTGMRPFFETVSDPSQKMCILFMKIIMGARPTIPSHIPPECQENLTKCWDSAPSARPSFQMLMPNIIRQMQRCKEEKEEGEENPCTM